MTLQQRYRRIGIDEVARRAERLVARVHNKLDVPADRAALRRGLGQSPEHPSVRACHAIVADLVDEHDDRATERAFYTVAALIAAQSRQARDDSKADPTKEAGDEPADGANARATDPAATRARPAPNLGATLASALNDHKLSVSEETTEARLHLLCRQNLDGLHRHLPRLVTHLRAELVPIDWVQLIVDLSRWNTTGDLVAKQWLQAFHRTLATNHHTTNPTDAPDKENQ
jgi:CRISPR system Cascade subunit CasB